MTNRDEIREGRAWAERLLGKAPPIVTPDERRAAIRREVEAEVDGFIEQHRRQTEAEKGRNQFRHATRHARAVTAPRDPRPDAPVGSTRKTADGTVWRREA